MMANSMCPGATKLSNALAVVEWMSESRHTEVHKHVKRRRWTEKLSSKYHKNF
jgi:hypothetical protein